MTALLDVSYIMTLKCTDPDIQGDRELHNQETVTEAMAQDLEEFMNGTIHCRVICL